MKPIESTLVTSEGYVNSITRNTVTGCWEVEVGLPITWVYDDDNENIECEVVFENESGVLIKLSPKSGSTEIVVVDDLVRFVDVIIKTNEMIAEKEVEFKHKMAEMKKVIEEQAKSYYKELDELKENSFKGDGDDKPKRGRPAGSKKKVLPPPMPEGRTIKEGGEVTPPPTKVEE